MGIDLTRVRADFPILGEEIHGNRLVYLDSGASAQKPVQVLDRMDHAYRHEFANVHRGLHTLANRATEAFEAGREKVRAFLNAERAEEIVFTRSATEAINLVAASFAGPRIGEGDEIVLSIMEHHSNIVPWHLHRERKGAVLRWVDVDDEGAFDLDAFAAALTDRTRMVAITHMSNVLGTITPLKKIEIAHARTSVRSMATRARCTRWTCAISARITSLPPQALRAPGSAFFTAMTCSPKCSLIRVARDEE